MDKQYRVAVVIAGTVLVDAPDRETAAAIAGSATPSLGLAPIFDRTVKAWTLDEPTRHALKVQDAELRGSMPGIN